MSSHSQEPLLYLGCCGFAKETYPNRTIKFPYLIPCRVKTYASSQEKIKKKRVDFVDSLQKILKKLKTKDETIITNAIENIKPGFAIGFNKNLEKLFDMPVGEIFEKIRDYNDTMYLIFDGILSKRLLSLSLNMKIKFIASKNKEEELIIPENIIVWFF